MSKQELTPFMLIDQIELLRNHTLACVGATLNLTAEETCKQLYTCNLTFDKDDVCSDFSFYYYRTLRIVFETGQQFLYKAEDFELSDKVINNRVQVTIPDDLNAIRVDKHEDVCMTKLTRMASVLFGSFILEEELDAKVPEELYYFKVKRLVFEDIINDGSGEFELELHILARGQAKPFHKLAYKYKITKEEMVYQSEPGVNKLPVGFMYEFAKSIMANNAIDKLIEVNSHYCNLYRHLSEDVRNELEIFKHIEHFKTKAGYRVSLGNPSKDKCNG